MSFWGFHSKIWVVGFSLFKSKQYLPLKGWVWSAMSHWKAWGSLNEIKEGLYWSKNCLRFIWLQRKPSIFQDMQISSYSSLVVASELGTKWSGDVSLNLLSLCGRPVEGFSFLSSRGYSCLTLGASLQGSVGLREQDLEAIQNISALQAGVVWVVGPRLLDGQSLSLLV